jgi:hypothetical protein
MVVPACHPSSDEKNKNRRIQGKKQDPISKITKAKKKGWRHSSRDSLTSEFKLQYCPPSQKKKEKKERN